MGSAAADQRLVMRDATFSRDKRDWLAAANAALRIFAAVEEDILKCERGELDREELTRRIMRRCEDVDPNATREAAAAVADVVKRWDENDATEFVAPHFAEAGPTRLSVVREDGVVLCRKPVQGGDSYWLPCLRAQGHAGQCISEVGAAIAH